MLKAVSALQSPLTLHLCLVLLDSSSLFAIQPPLPKDVIANMTDLSCKIHRGNGTWTLLGDDQLNTFKCFMLRWAFYNNFHARKDHTANFHCAHYPGLACNNLPFGISDDEPLL